MRQAPSFSSDDTESTMLDAGEALLLRQEIARLRRENRSLSIALAEMERVAERDMLTPLYNRRYFLSALHQRIARVNHDGQRCVLIFVDVDGLKAINDRFGHAAGDFALLETARRLSDGARPTDVLARIGGDEFGLLMDNVGQTEARSKLRRMAALIADEPCIFDGHEIPLSAACGMTPILPGASAEELLGRADADMYRAKRQ